LLVQRTLLSAARSLVAAHPYVSLIGKRAFTYQGETLERRVRPLAESVRSKFVEPLNVQDDAQIDRVMAKFRETYGTMDILVHSVAFANKEDLEGRFVDTTRQGFLHSMDISAYSLVALTKKAEPLME
jgi:enoyl-[acyl-carrier protein] reductase I